MIKKVKCLDKRYGNFTYGKIYEAESFATKGLGKHRQPVIGCRKSIATEITLIKNKIL